MVRQIDAGLLADRLWEWRQAAGWSQAETARQAGVSPTSVNHLETGQIERPRLDTVRKLARAFGISVGEFMAGERVSDPLGGASSQLLEQVRALSASERRHLALGAAPGWVDSQDQTLSAISQASTLAKEHGISRDQLWRVLLSHSPLLARELLVGMENHEEAIEEAMRAYEMALHDAVEDGRLPVFEMASRLNDFAAA